MGRYDFLNIIEGRDSQVSLFAGILEASPRRPCFLQAFPIDTNYGSVEGQAKRAWGPQPRPAGRLACREEHCPWPSRPASLAPSWFSHIPPPASPIPTAAASLLAFLFPLRFMYLFKLGAKGQRGEGRGNLADFPLTRGPACAQSQARPEPPGAPSRPSSTCWRETRPRRPTRWPQLSFSAATQLCGQGSDQGGK